MRAYSLSHLDDQQLLRELSSLIAHDRATTADVLAHIAEVDERKLYLPAAQPSMFAYCVHELHLSEDSAYRRITAARTARRFPALFQAIADGRLNLSAVILLAPYLNPENVDGLLRAAARKTKSEVEQLLAERFPRSEMLPLMEAVPASCQLVQERVGTEGSTMLPLMEAIPASCQLVPERVGMESGVQARGPRSRVTPIAPQRFAIHAMIDQSAHDDLRQAQALLGHQLPSGDVGAVLERALRLLVVDLEKRKFAATEQPQRKPRPTTSPRHIPAHVKRAVWGRDGGQCTYVGENGRHCASRTRLEFDHIDPVALGGEATVDRMRLRCRAHNQYTAACELGTQFMSDKRHSARQHAAANARARAAARQREARASAEAADRDVVPWLRQLGYRAEEARAAARFCESAPDDTLEDRVRLALSYFRPRTTRQGRVACPAG